MIEAPQTVGIEINPAEWQATPESIQALVMDLVRENQRLQIRVSQIEEQLRQNSQNSSKPPSQDGFGKKGANREASLREETRWTTWTSGKSTQVL